MTVAEYMNEFNPHDYGIVQYFESGARNKNVQQENESYVLCGLPERENKQQNRITLSIVLTESVGERIIRDLGRIVNFGYDESGSFFLWPGNARQIQHQETRNSRYVISINAIANDYLEQMGKFRRLFVKPEFFGNFVKLSMTGKRDAR